MNKMNLREFAEVLVAMMNQQGTVCFLNNDNPAKQLAVAMSKGDACAYAPVAPLWDSYEKGADLNQMAAAVSMAMKESLDKGSEMAKMNADRCAQQSAPSFKKHEVKETSDRFSNMGRNHAEYSAEPSQGQPKAARKEFFPNTEEGRQKAMKMLQDIMGTLPDTMAASSGCSDNRFVSDSNGPCSGDCFCGNRCKPNRTYRPEPAKQGNDDYDPTDDLPENLRSQLGEILKRIFLGADVLKNVADKMGESVLMVMPVSEEFVAVFPASDTTSVNGTVLKNVIKALKNLAPDEVLSNNVYLYDREHNLLAMESYQL